MPQSKWMSLDDALDEVQVMHRDAADLDCVIQWWAASMPWGVSTSNAGVIALFARERDANAFRLLLVNMLCNCNCP